MITNWLPLKKQFTCVSLIGLYLASVVACKPFGDSKEDLGIVDTNVSQSGLVGSWTTQDGNSLSIKQDSTFLDSTCNQSGQIIYISGDKSCPAGVRQCGSLTFSKAPFHDSIGCSSPGKTICTFFLSSDSGTLQLACADSQRKLNYVFSAQ